MILSNLRNRLMGMFLAMIHGESLTFYCAGASNDNPTSKQNIQSDGFTSYSYE